MKTQFRHLHGARLINVVTTFLNSQGISIPELYPGQAKILYTSDDGNISITYVCLGGRCYGYYRIIEDSTITSTKEFQHL